MYISPLKVEGIFFDLLDHKSASSLTDKYLTRTVWEQQPERRLCKTHQLTKDWMFYKIIKCLLWEYSSSM